MIKHEVQYQADAVSAQFTRQIADCSIVPSLRIDFAIAADRITAVVVAFRAAEERHQMQIRQAEFFEVRNLLAQAVEIAREQIDVAHAAQHLIRLKPLRMIFAFRSRALNSTDSASHIRAVTFSSSSR